MSQAMTIEIVAVSPPTQEKSARGMQYEKCEVTYKNLTFQGKVEAKTLVSFTNPDMFKKLSTASFKDVFTILRNKNEKSGYWDWVGFDNGMNEQEIKESEQGVSNMMPANKSPKSTYETAEERAARQVMIVRQSSISSAINMLGISKKATSTDEVIAVARDFEAYVLGTQNNISNSFEGMDNDPL